MIPIHLDNKYDNLYIAYNDNENNKRYKIIKEYECEFFISKKQDPIIDIDDAERITFSTTREKQSLLEALKNDYNLYLSDVSIINQFYLNEFKDYKELPKHQLNIAFIDIEALIEKFSLNGEYPVSAITIGVYNTQQLITFCYKNDKVKLKKNISSDEIFVYDDEKSMLSAFIEFMNKNKFDIMTGWNFSHGDNGSGFDNPYLINRLKHFNIDKNLSPFGIIEKEYRTDDYKVFGLPSIDYLSVYKKYQFKELPSYRLDAVAEVENIAKKISFEGTLNELYENDFEKYIKYNRRDVQIMIDLENKKQYFSLISEIRNLSFVNYNTINNSQIIDNLLIKKLRTTNKIAKSKSFNDSSGIPGAYVKQPKPGIYDWVIDLDYTSLYPFIIMNFNISPDTKVGYIDNWDEININIKSLTDDELDSVNTIDKTKIIDVIFDNDNLQLTHEQFLQFLHDNNLIVSNFGILFSKNKKGVFPELLEWIFEMRKIYKNKKIEANKIGDEVNKMLYHYKQLTFKVLLNSFYGFVGFPGSRFFDKDLGSSVTMSGRKLIRYAIQYATNQGYHVITTDTDSILFNNDNVITDVNSAITSGKLLSEQIDTSLVNWCKQEFNIDNSTFNIKQEIVARRGVFFAKKRYTLWKVNEEGADIDEIEYKGIEIVRNSTPPLIRKQLVDIFTTALKNDNPYKTIKEKLSIYRKEIRQVNTSEIGIRCSMSKDIFNGYTKSLPVHVRGALVYEMLFAEEFKGSFTTDIKGRYYFLTKDAEILNEIRQDEKLTKLLLGTNTKKNVISIPESSDYNIDHSQINYDYMEERLLNKPLRHLLTILEVKFQIKKFVDYTIMNNSTFEEKIKIIKQYAKTLGVKLDKKNLKRITSKNLEDKYYNLYLVSRAIQELSLLLSVVVLYLENENNTNSFASQFT